MSNPAIDFSDISHALRITGCPFEIHHRGQSWECIGQGYQYTAYGTLDKALKIPLETDQVCAKFRALFGSEPDRALVARDHENSLAVIRTTRERLDDGRLPRTLLAGAAVSEQLWIEQERAIPLRDAFERATEAEQRILIDRYVECAKRLITYGAHETGFALLDNFGLNSTVEVVALDFGELTFVKDIALQSIFDKPWTKDRGGIKLLSGVPLEYYLESMARNLTSDFVEAHWPKTA